MYDSDRRRASNRHPILKSMSDFYVTDICTSDLSFSQILKSMSFIKFSNLWPLLTFSNQCPMTSLTYALTLTNKSAIDLRIWKGHQFENTLKSDHDLKIMTSVDDDLRSGH